MTPREQFICVISNDTLKVSDAIIILEGDHLNRIPECGRLYREGWAPLVVISGGLDMPPHSIPASQMLDPLVRAGVPQNAIILESKSQNTRDQAVELAALCAERAWRRIIITVSHYHQYRAYLTMLRGLEEKGLEQTVELINAPARQLPWFVEREIKQDPRIDLLNQEFQKIDEYCVKGHLASFEDALKYQAWKERRN
jgi:hypothetical protein